MKNLKKLSKLKLMPEKMLKQEELVNFRGGSGEEGNFGGGPNQCWIYVEGQVWTNLTVAHAQQAYQTNSENGLDARYCCASCCNRTWTNCVPAC